MNHLPVVAAVLPSTGPEDLPRYFQTFRCTYWLFVRTFYRYYYDKDKIYYITSSPLSARVVSTTTIYGDYFFFSVQLFWQSKHSKRFIFKHPWESEREREWGTETRYRFMEAFSLYQFHNFSFFSFFLLCSLQR